MDSNNKKTRKPYMLEVLCRYYSELFLLLHTFRLAKVIFEANVWTLRKTERKKEESEGNSTMFNLMQLLLE